MMATLYFVGGAGLDVVLRVPRFPAEDTKLRVQEVSRATGGNACNSAVVAAQVVRALAALGADAAPYGGGLPPAAPVSPVHLVAPCASPAHDADARFVADRLAAAPGLAAHWVPVGDSGMPVSYVIDAADTASRTILHSRGIRELRADEALAALVGDGGCGRAAGAAAARHPSGAALPRPLHWVHIEARSVPATAALLAALRSAPPSAATAAGAATADVVTCIEVEKARADGDVEALLWGGSSGVEADPAAGAAAAAFAASSPPHVAVVSHEYALSAGREGGGDGGAVTDGPSALARLQPRLPPGTLLVVPWGEQGVYASMALPTADDSSSRHMVQVHVPAHPPAYCCAGGGDGGSAPSQPPADPAPPSPPVAAPTASGCPLVSTLGAGDTFNAALAVAGAASVVLRLLWFPPTDAAAAPPLSPGAVTSAMRAVLEFAALVAGEKCGCPSLELGAPLGHPAMRQRMARLLAQLQQQQAAPHA
jgi:hypothetical protein